MTGSEKNEWAGVLKKQMGNWVSGKSDPFLRVRLDSSRLPFTLDQLRGLLRTVRTLNNFIGEEAQKDESARLGAMVYFSQKKPLLVVFSKEPSKEEAQRLLDLTREVEKLGGQVEVVISEEAYRKAESTKNPKGRS